jgi:hypothetical protein
LGGDNSDARCLVARPAVSHDEKGLHIKRRKEVWEQVQGARSTESETNCTTLAKPKTGRGNKQFAADIAKVTGASKVDINRKLRRTDAIGAVDLKKISGTRESRHSLWLFFVYLPSLQPPTYKE